MFVRLEKKNISPKTWVIITICVSLITLTGSNEINIIFNIIDNVDFDVLSLTLNELLKMRYENIG
jgi:hypothetical protein